MKPILFNTEMVRAILEGRKTVTRRVVKLPSHILLQDNGIYAMYTEDSWYKTLDLVNFAEYLKKPYKAGDILYVRETWGCYNRHWWESSYFLYKADYNDNATTYEVSGHVCDLPKWKPSIHMPKEAARIFLRVTDVRVERLHDMKLIDYLAEGISNPCDTCKRFTFDECDTCGREGTIGLRFAALWDSTIKADHEHYGYTANPYVWVIEFERVEKSAAV